MRGTSEFGTNDTAAHAFMRPAAEAHRDPWVGDVRAFGRVIERVLSAGGFL